MSGIVDLSRDRVAPERATDVCVIGSGCGGATAAWVLAEAGREVLMLEEGKDLTGLALDQRDRTMYDQLYMDRGGRATDDLAISVLQGRALGGGGVINASDVVPIPDGVLAHWRARHGLGELTDARMAPFRERALADLSASRIRDDQLNEANLLLQRGAEALGVRGEVMLHNRVGCAGMGTCLIGCPLDAKRNPRFVAVPGAIAAGADVWLRARVTRIELGRGDARITVRALDGLGYREERELVVRARTVIVAANAIGTAQLLLRSGLGNGHVGKHLMLQPQLPVVARFDHEVRAFRGIPQAYAVTDGEVIDDDGLSGFRIEAIMGTPGIVASLMPNDNTDHAVFEGSWPSGSEMESFKDDFRTSVYEAWNDQLARVCATPQHRVVRCAVEIEFTDDEREMPHLRIHLLFRPCPSRGTASRHPHFRASCAFGGARTPTGTPDRRAFDMKLGWSGRGTTGRSGFHQDNVVEVSPGRTVSFAQNVAAHEFGHYLGLEHTCARYVSVQDGGRCSLGEYCLGRSRYELANIMAVGSDHQPNHIGPWGTRLLLHHRYCDHLFTGRVL